MRSLAAVCLLTAVGGCSYPVAVQPLPGSDVPLPLAPSPESVGLLVDVARVPEEIAVQDSVDNPFCAFTRYPLAARASVAESVLATIDAAVRDVRVLDAPTHRWNLQNEGLDAALVVRVEAFTILLTPMRKVMGAEFEAEADLTLSVTVVTRESRGIHRMLEASATEMAVDSWGLGGCSRGVPPAARAAERAIRNAMAELTEWTAETLRSARGLQKGQTS